MSDLFTPPTTPQQHLEQLVRAGQRMRQLQREYFKTRARDTLIASKEAEREFDRLVTEGLAGPAAPASGVDSVDGGKRDA